MTLNVYFNDKVIEKFLDVSDKSTKRGEQLATLSYFFFF